MSMTLSICPGVTILLSMNMSICPGVTILLSMTMFLNMVSQTMPITSDNPLLGNATHAQLACY